MEREESDLYGLPLDEFVEARTELERRLRKEGDRERAAAVKKLPKPSVAAWAVNQASRSQPKHRRDLLDASAELRDTQERLIAGDASAADLDKAARRQRAAIDALTDAASGLLTSEGKAMADATLARVRETLAAVAADEELAELFEAGTLDRERRPAGLGFGFGGLGGEAEEPARTPKRPSRATPEKGKPRETKPGEAKERAKADKARQQELSAARERAKEAKAAEREAQKRQKAAEKEAEKAAKGLERAERAAEEARERADEARRAAQEARGQLDAAAAAAEEAAGEREAAEAELDRLGSG